MKNKKIGKRRYSKRRYSSVLEDTQVLSHRCEGKTYDMLNFSIFNLVFGKIASLRTLKYANFGHILLARIG